MWTDDRLSFEGNDTLRVSINFLERIWKPDTHFFNGQKSYIHMVTSPNKLLRIDPNGAILYSMR
jgi:gamma-aminobutyric acid receptor subunit alpha